MWANENWTRRWDGSEHEVLLAQSYRREDEAALVATFVRHFADKRYIRLEGRPVLMVYRARLIPRGAVARWRAMFARAGENPLFVMAQSFEDRDPRPFGMDAAVEFPPHKHTDRLETINGRLHLLDDGMTARVYDYEAFAQSSDLARQHFPLIRTAVPSWDNDPRRQGAGMVVHGATPQAYQAWLERLVTTACEQTVGGEAIVCVNAWNEWGEGAYLEPDVHFGAAFLNATARAVSRTRAGVGRKKLLLVGHDAFPAGAQLLLLHLGRVLQESLGAEVAFLLLGEGALVPRYREVAPTVVLPQGLDLAAQASGLRAQGFGAALVNSAATAGVCGALADAGFMAVLLVHEMPRLLRERELVGPLQAAVERVQRVVFGNTHVRDRVAELVAMSPARTTVLPHGLYRPVLAKDRAGRRARLRVPEGAVLAIGMGYADLRKGFDLFLQAWRVAQRSEAGPVHMLWVGDIDRQVHTYLGAELAAAQATGTFHHIGFAPDGADWFAAADALLLTSREDPLPTVVMEAMSAGLPVIAFEEAGGAPDLVRECGAGGAVPLGDVQAMVEELVAQVGRATPARRRALATQARRRFDFAAYAGALLRLLCPGEIDVSAVVPSFNYGRYLPGRLASIFAQEHRLAEVVVIDDASTDDSEAVVRREAATAGRRVRWEGRKRNGGSVFEQWRRAAEAVGSEWLWIAEADDLAEPGFLGAMAAAIARQPDAVLAFCDSRAVDAEGATLWPDHKGYYRSGGAAMLAQDGVLDAAEVLRTCLGGRNMILNASAVLWRRTALLAALDRCRKELATFRMAGDWRLYAEVLAGGGRVVYVAEPLNVHRRHAASVTHRLEPSRHLDELRRMQKHMRRVLPASPDLVRMQRRAMSEARLALTASAGAPGRSGRGP